LAKGVELVQNQLPNRGSDDLGKDWQGWIFAQVLMDEATALVTPPSQIESNTKKP